MYPDASVQRDSNGRFLVGSRCNIHHEVIDPASGEVLGRQRLETSGDWFTNDGVIVGDRWEGPLLRLGSVCIPPLAVLLRFAHHQPDPMQSPSRDHLDSRDRFA